jgi:hypothetical protein
MKKYLHFIPLVAATLITINVVYDYFSEGLSITENNSFQTALLLLILAGVMKMVLNVKSINLE